jgi:hypothetical protein
MTPPRERPILMSSSMIKALLEGRKSQTRRALKPQPHIADASYGDVEESERYPGEWFQWCCGEPGPAFLCPHGAAGERLWVRETWGLIRNKGELGVTDWDGPIPPARPGGWDVTYRATDGWESHFDDRGFNWRPSIFMPRWASRIDLELTGVRVERLQEISYQDCVAEGIPPVPCMDDHADPETIIGAIRSLYAKLWDQVNMPRPGCDWSDNPWCWVLEFKVTKPSLEKP